MDDKQQLMELYKEFIYTKENFVDRSFATNKFYIIALTLCFVALAWVKEALHPTGSAMVIAISLAGMVFSFLLWANQDAYAYLLKIKFDAVIDKMEEKFCFQPCVEEKRTLVENAKKKKSFVFANVPKGFALVTMTIFFAAFLFEFSPMFWNSLTSIFS